MNKSPKRISIKDENFFFGYYDKSPWNSAQNKILAHHINIVSELPDIDDFADIGYFFKSNNGQWNWVKIARTNAWNFQMGSMLQWIDDDYILFNISNSSSVGSLIYNISTHENRKINYPVYSLAKCKTKFLTIDFTRISKFRPGYGYSILTNRKLPAPDDDYISIFDLATNSVKKLLSLDWFIKNKFVSEADNFWVDHFIFNPSGDKVAFNLRVVEGEAVQSSVFVLDIESCRCVNILNTGMASHADWFDDNTYALWGRRASVVKSFQKLNSRSVFSTLFKYIRKFGVPNFVRKNVYRDAFIKIDVGSKCQEEFASCIPANEGAGHFSFSNDRKFLLNDSPLLENGHRELMLVDLTTNKKIIIDQLYTPKSINFTPFRCDLHPRFSSDNFFVCIDSNHEGYRGIYIYDIRDFINA